MKLKISDLLRTIFGFQVGTISQETSKAIIYKCDRCTKTYKTKGGLERHEEKIHENKPPKLHSLNLKVIIRESVKKLSNDIAFPESVRNELLNLNFELSSEEIISVWQKFNPIFENFNGCAEKFYSKMFKFSLPDKEQLFPRLSRCVSI